MHLPGPAPGDSVPRCCASAPPTRSPRREVRVIAADWVAGTQLDGVGRASRGRGGGPRAKAACLRRPASCGLGEWEVEARALSAFRHEFPDRLQHHDYLPGEPPPPAAGPFSLLSPGRLRASAVRPARLPLSSPAAFARLIRVRAPGGCGICPVRFPPASTRGVLRPSAPPPPQLHLPTTPHLPLPRPLLEGGRWPPRSGPVRREGSPPRSFWTEQLTHGPGQCVVPGAE